MQKKILFVCLGNICRSPLAEAIAKDYSKKNNLDLYIQSAGTGDWHIGEAPCSNSQTVAIQNGIDISSYKARQVTLDDDKEFDYIFALDSKNIADLTSLGFTKHQKLCTDDVPDPYFFPGFEGFDKVYKMIERCVITQLKKIVMFENKI
jgi:protein-tyrosine phosphatase